MDFGFAKNFSRPMDKPCSSFRIGRFRVYDIIIHAGKEGFSPYGFWDTEHQGPVDFPIVTPFLAAIRGKRSSNRFWRRSRPA